MQAKDDLNEVTNWPGDWEDGYPTGVWWINCQDCGHSWRTRRAMPS